MLDVLLIRPGATNFDEEGRIKGALDIPLSQAGNEQAKVLAGNLQPIKLDCLYVAPCESARATAAAIGERNFCRQKSLDCLRNLDLGLWQGKLTNEVRRLQPRVYRQFQEHPTDVSPPAGETVSDALARVRPAFDKLIRKHRDGCVAFLVPHPMAAIVRFALVGGSLGDLWEPELGFGKYETIRVSGAAINQDFALETV